MQLEPSLTFEYWQTPPEQPEAVLHAGTLVAQFTQAFPLSPHAPVVLPVSQEFPSQQPVQQLPS